MSITLLSILTILLTVLVVLVIMYNSAANSDSEIDDNIYLDCLSADLNKKQTPEYESIDIMKNKMLYEIQCQASTIEFYVGSTIGKIKGSFQNFDGHFSLLKTGENKEPASIDVNVGSLNVDTDFIDKILRSEDFFDVENFPSISFTGSSFEWVNDKNAILIGDMIIKNVTRKIAFHVEQVDFEKDASETELSKCITMKATANIRRSEFGLLSMASIISDNVSLQVNIEALKITALDEKVMQPC